MMPGMPLKKNHVLFEMLQFAGLLGPPADESAVAGGGGGAAKSDLAASSDA